MTECAVCRLFSVYLPVLLLLNVGNCRVFTGFGRQRPDISVKCLLAYAEPLEDARRDILPDGLSRDLPESGQRRFHLRETGVRA